jgi:hypothetical protein
MEKVKKSTKAEGENGASLGFSAIRRDVSGHHDMTTASP